ncbi:MAG TPA: enoyl-CoA hydratase-related protein [Anaerolineae bacterium]|nr:enoyl-CoA hydratase-related protein [Anaerolineae bacterium]
MAERQYVKVSIEDRVAILTIDNPPVNMISVPVMNDLLPALNELFADDDVKTIVITGGGQMVFVAGADINAILQLKTPAEAKAIVTQVHDLFQKIENSPKPIIAAINGHCLGAGNELAMACHMRIANNRAMFGQPEIGLGIIPGFGGTQRLSRLVGKGKALELILTGDRITGAEAASIGLVNKAVPGTEVMKTAMGLAKKISSYGRPAIAAAVEAVNEGMQVSLSEGLEIEADKFSSLVETQDMREGLTAFLEKRQPKFQDK